MKIFYDFLPIAVFFVIYKLYGIYPATASAIIISIIQVAFYWAKHRRFDMMQVITFWVILIFGGATLILHNDMFIKWKPTILNGLFALVFWGSHWFGEKTVLRRVLEDKIKLPDQIWIRLNYLWIGYFLLMGTLNLIVVYNFSTDVWVNFKLFGMLGLTLVFALLQGIYLSKHMESDNPA
ncbi:MAG: septation protein A [Gammaproteobacteria bacterium]|nr:septation protein A [Gammaproteobacteria bacterium]